jgi:hypothetical protein
MSLDVAVGGRLEEHALAKLSVNCPLQMPTPSQLLRWAWARAAGMNYEQALSYATNGKSLATLSNGSRDRVVRLTEDVAIAVREKFPDKTDAWIMRYVVAINSGYSKDQAEEIASVDKRHSGSRNRNAA